MVINLEKTQVVKFDIQPMNASVTVKVTLHYDLMGQLNITTQIGDEPPNVRQTNLSNENIVKKW